MAKPKKKYTEPVSLPMLPLRGLMVFPHMVLHFDAGRKKSIAALDQAMEENQRIFLVAQRDMDVDDPAVDDIYHVGTIACVKQVLRLPGGNVRLLVEGKSRAVLRAVTQEEPYFVGALDEVLEQGTPVSIETDALLRTAHHYFEEYCKMSGRISGETMQSVLEIEDPGQLADIIAANVLSKIEDRQQVLEEFDELARLESVCALLVRETELAGVEKKVQADALSMQNFSDEEKKMIDDFSKQINILDTNLVFSYGAGAQQNISQFSDSALKNVQTHDLDHVGDMIGDLVVELRGFDTDDEENKGFLGFFKRKSQSLSAMKARYSTVETNVNKICESLEKHQIQLLKDIAMLDKLYDQNLMYFKELSMYIAAGKQRLETFRANEVKAAYDKAEQSKLPEDAQAAKDLSDKADRFEKKLYDLELTRNISIQMAPQIRLIQSSNQLMAEKIQTSLINTIPLWKNQMVLALGIAHTQEAMEAQRAVNDLTNDLLRKNAEKMHMATVESAKEAERGIVDIETLKQTNQQLINTMDEVLAIQQQGREKRKAAEAELATIEDELRKKMLEVRK